MCTQVKIFLIPNCSSKMPSKRITDKLHFFQAASWAAEKIFNYRRVNPEVSGSAHGFDCGEVSEDKRIATAVFSCVATSGRGSSILLIFAMKSGDEILVTHSLSSAA